MVHSRFIHRDFGKYMILEATMENQKNLKVGLPICAYTAFIILSYAETNVSGFRIYTSILVFIAAILMALNILRISNPQYRLKCALWELGYCIIVWETMKILNNIAGNILGGIVVIICCIIYLKYINPKYMHRYILGN